LHEKECHGRSLSSSLFTRKVAQRIFDFALNYKAFVCVLECWFQLSLTEGNKVISQNHQLSKSVLICFLNAKFRKVVNTVWLIVMVCITQGLAITTLATSHRHLNISHIQKQQIYDKNGKET